MEPASFWGFINIEHWHKFGQSVGGETVQVDMAPESTRKFMDLTSAILVVSMLTFSFRDLGSSLVEAMMSLDGAGSLGSQQGGTVVSVQGLVHL